MKPDTFGLVIDPLIAENNYFEGMLIHPTEPNHGIVVFRKTDNDLTLVLYKIGFQPPSQYHIEYHLLTKTFPIEQKLQAFLQPFTTLTAEEFWTFIETCTN